MAFELNRRTNQIEIQLVFLLALLLLLAGCTRLPNDEVEFNALIEEEFPLGMGLEKARNRLTELGFGNIRFYDPKILYPNSPPKEGEDYREILSGRVTYIPCGNTRYAQIRIVDEVVADRMGFFGITCL